LTNPRREAVVPDEAQRLYLGVGMVNFGYLLRGIVYVFLTPQVFDFYDVDPEVIKEIEVNSSPDPWMDSPPELLARAFGKLVLDYDDYMSGMNDTDEGGYAFTISYSNPRPTMLRVMPGQGYWVEDAFVEKNEKEFGHWAYPSRDQ